MGNHLTESVCYATFRDIIRAIHACAKVEDIASLLVMKLTRAFEAAGTIMQLFSSSQEEPVVSLAYGLSQPLDPKASLLQPSARQELLSQKKVWVSKDLLNDGRLALGEFLWQSGVRMLILAPLGLRGEPAGLVAVALKQVRELTPVEEDFLAAVAQQCTCALDKAWLIERQQQQFDQLAYQTERLTALGRMAAGVAHELNNPLSSILLFSSNLKKKTTDSFFQEGLEIIIQETKRCKAIIQDLQEFSRSKEPKKTVGNINQILEKVLHLLENEFRKNHIRINRELAGKLPDMLLDIGQMQQVFANLLLNAIEAVKSGGEVSVKTAYDSERRQITIEVADTGPGIPLEYLPRIFEPFFSTKAKGTGLGLAVTYGFVMNHQGDIQVQSQPGQGTRFTIQLPVNQMAV